MVKCLVTGVAGFIGSHLGDALLSMGYSVVGVDSFTDYYAKSIKVSNLSSLRKTRKFRFVQADLSSSNLSPLLRDVDYVFHLAAQPGVRASWGASFSHYTRDNITATQRILESSKGRRLQKLIFASSSSIYGDSESFPTRENADPKPISPYGITKLAGENLCRVYLKNYGIPIAVLRYFTAYGPRQRPDMSFHRFIRAIASGNELEVYGDGTQTRDFTFVSDIVSATTRVMEARPGTVLNVGSGSSVSVNEAISVIESAVGRKAKVRRLPSAAGDVKHTCADVSKLVTELGYKPKTSLKDGVELQVRHQLSRM